MSNTWVILMFVVSYLVGAFLCVFIAWRKLHEDYISSLFFGISFKIIFTSTLFALLAHFLLKPRIPVSTILNPDGLWFWGAVIGFIGSFIYLQKKNRLRIYEMFDAFGIGYVWWFLVFLFTHFLFSNEISTLILLGGGIGTLILYTFFQINYRKFSWYKSGKVGFSALASIGTFFLIRSVIAISDLSMISFVGKIDSVLSASIAFVMFYSLYNLSQN